MRLISQDTMSQYSTNFLLLPIPEYPVLDCVPNKIIKLVVLGGSSVGKTALVVRFLTKRFIGDYEANAGALYSRKFTIDGEQISLQVQDTPFVSLECTSSPCCECVSTLEELRTTDRAEEGTMQSLGTPQP
uniref:small monomeric GTPase n=1 Tax=Gallus gallus TaxID=9031 RepID=A0A8V0YGG5_CHICK